MNKLVVLSLMLVVLGACSPKVDSRNPATLRDEIFSVEPRTNGTYTIWLVHDDVAAYCTNDKVIGERALAAVRGNSSLVVITYVNTTAILFSDGVNLCAAEGAKYIFAIRSLEILQP